MDRVKRLAMTAGLGVVVVGLGLWGMAVSQAGPSAAVGQPDPRTDPRPEPQAQPVAPPPGPAVLPPTMTADGEAIVGPTLALDDPAPAIEVTRWLQGGPVGEFGEGMVYVVDFFATWAPAAGEATRVLTRLEIGMQGKARVVGIASHNPERAETVETVAAFIEQQGSALRYGVAFDARRLMFERYMTASGQAGVPHSFVVDGRGRLAWHGHPMDPQLEAVVDLVVKGEWDTGAYQRLQEEQAKADGLMTQAVEAWNTGEREKTVELLQEIFEIAPGRFGQHAVWKFHALHVEMGESERAYAYAKELIEGPLAGSADALADLAWVVLEAPVELPYDDIVAEMAARRALEVTGQQHGHAWAAIALIEGRRQNFLEAQAAWEQALVFVDDESLENVYLQRKREMEAERERAIRGG